MPKQRNYNAPDLAVLPELGNVGNQMAHGREGYMKDFMLPTYFQLHLISANVLKFDAMDVYSLTTDTVNKELRTFLVALFRVQSSLVLTDTL